MVSLWLRSVLYLSLVGGAWLVLLPAMLWRGFPSDPVFHSHSQVCPLIGAVLSLVGASLAIWSGAWLIRKGEGTPFPLDPTRRLVTGGPYAIVRNPQGIALMLLTAGEAIAANSAVLFVLPILAVLFLEGLAGPFEDWELRRRFGRAYERYRDRVPKWVPRKWVLSLRLWKVRGVRAIARYPRFTV